jgi:hypothetical protein
MVSKINPVDGEHLPEAGQVERTESHQAMVDQGLRLNRAFASIKDPLVREAIVNIVAEAATQHPSDAIRSLSLSISPPEAPARRRPRM